MPEYKTKGDAGGGDAKKDDKSDVIAGN
jgi:hypothetical protein